MKKAFALILGLAMVLSIAACAFADDAPAFSLPLYSSPEEVDVEEVLAGNAMGKLLDAFGSVQLTYYMENIQPDGTYKDDIVDTYFLIDGVYYSSSTQLDKVYNSKVEYFYECNEDDPYQYVRHMGGKDKYEYPVENFLEGMNFSFFPCTYAESDKLEVLSAEEADGLYVITYRLDYSNGNDPYEITISIDPATSLIKALSYTLTFNIEGMGQITNSREGTVDYGVDAEPLYDVRG